MINRTSMINQARTQKRYRVEGDLLRHLNLLNVDLLIIVLLNVT